MLKKIKIIFKYLIDLKRILPRCLLSLKLIRRIRISFLKIFKKNLNLILKNILKKLKRNLDICLLTFLSILLPRRHIDIDVLIGWVTMISNISRINCMDNLRILHQPFIQTNVKTAVFLFRRDRFLCVVQYGNFLKLDLQLLLYSRT